MPTQAERIDALEASLQSITANNTLLQQALLDANERLETANNRIEALSLPHPTPEEDTSRTRSQEPKVASPEFFYGHRNKVNQFITQLRMVITLQASRFQDEHTKVGYAATFLREEALLWLQPYLNKPLMDQPDWMHNFDEFIKELKRIFGDPDEVATAERQLFRCKQRGSASRYITEFRRHAALLHWDNSALAAQFYRGLRENIKDEIARIGRPNDLEELINTAIRIDNRFFERQLESRDYNTPPLFTKRPFDNTRGGMIPKQSPPPQSVPPAQRYAGQPQKPGYTRHLTPAGRLTPDEYKRRQALGACVYCADYGHISRDCPKKQKDTPATRTPTAKPAQFKATQKPDSKDLKA